MIIGALHITSFFVAYSAQYSAKCNENDLKNMTLIKSFMTSLAQSGVLRANEDGGLELKLEALIEKSLENRQQLSLPDKKIEELEELKGQLDSKINAYKKIHLKKR
jgi:hypothetical protein